MDTHVNIREAWPQEIDATRKLLGRPRGRGMTLVAQGESSLLAACRCVCLGSAGCSVRIAAATDADGESTWHLFNRTAGRMMSAGTHRLRVDNAQQVDDVWQRAQWGDQPDFSDASQVVRVMGRR